ncbi:hypothetical protein Nepgr_017853 [Nepenthes gracilis]|uniref:Uncharacterized protein n=1 Tax=Nepenthes gracilis TaxID=150966 RepID=A0AAD3SRX5_NEPGR|nr:hypothetical protein Nepgr_017853 [Nepenthes gracilis]
MRVAVGATKEGGSTGERGSSTKLQTRLRKPHYLVGMLTTSLPNLLLGHPLPGMHCHWLVNGCSMLINNDSNGCLACPPNWSLPPLTALSQLPW